MKFDKPNRMLAAAITLALAHTGITVAAADDEKVLATVNGKALTEKDLALAETEVGGNLGDLPPATKRRALVEYLIENQLFADAAESAKMGDGTPFADKMAYYRRRALRELYFDANVKNAISEGAAKTFYDDRVKSVKPEEEVQARHILLESEDDAKDMSERIARGADFAELAKEHSRDPGTKAQGGMLGYFSKGQMVPVFEQAAYSLEKGEVSEPVKSRFGWHLIKLEDKRQKPLPKFEEVKEQILNNMIHSKAQAVAKQLRDKAKVEYVDEQVKKEVARQAAQDRNNAQTKAVEQFKKHIEQQEKNKAKQ